MLTIETLDHIEALLTSDQVTLKGSQFMVFGQIVQALQQERKMIMSLMALPVGGQANGTAGNPTVRDIINAKIEAADNAAAEDKGRKQ